MKTKLLLIYAFLNLTGSYILAQEKAIEIRYKGGEEELHELIARNIRYPVKCKENKLVGFSITGITITNDGKILEISTINPIDESIEKDIYRVLKMTSKNWLKSDTILANQTFYIQIIYAITRPGEPPVFNSPVGSKYNFIEPVIVSAMSLKEDELPIMDEIIAIKVDEKIKSNEYRDALKYINELIRRNPFNKELYQFRMYINKKLNNNDLIIKDSHKIQNFIPGASIDELINEN